MAQQEIGSPTGCSDYRQWPKVQANFTELYNSSLGSVKNYGAVGDGVTDDTAAFTAAFADKKTVFVPEGTYVANISLGYYQNLLGEGGRVSKIVAPAGSQQVILVDGTDGGRNRVGIKGVSILNTNNVANCKAINFKGVDVNSINDFHHLEDLYIDGFDTSLDASGRLIWSSFKDIRCENGRVGINFNTDATTAALNQLKFINVSVRNMTEEGAIFTGESKTISLDTCNFELNNTLNAVGVAALYIEDAKNFQITNCYFEANGWDDPSRDPVNPSNNSFAIHISGSYGENVVIKDSHIAESNCLVYSDTKLKGGSMSNNRVSTANTGFVFANEGLVPSLNEPRFIYDSSNYNTENSQIVITVDGNAQMNTEARQGNSVEWVSYDQSYDLINNRKFIVDPNGTTFTGITAISNMLPGLELTVYNENATNDFTLDSGLMVSGHSGIVSPKTSKTFMVTSYPSNGRFIEI